MFWRKPAAAPHTEPSAEDAPAPPAEAADEPAAGSVAPPGLAVRFLERIAFWRRAGKAQENVEAEADTQTNLPAAGPAEAPADGAVHRPLAKRVLLIFVKKTVWLPAAAVLLIALGAGLSTLTMRAQQGEQDKAMRTLRAEKLQLERENQKLRAQPAIIPATVTKPAPAAAASRATADPAFAVAADSGQSGSGGENGSGDCLVTDKEKVGESLRRCIEAFNQATSSSGRKR